MEQRDEIKKLIDMMIVLLNISLDFFLLLFAVCKPQDSQGANITLNDSSFLSFVSFQINFVLFLSSNEKKQTQTLFL